MNGTIFGIGPLEVFVILILTLLVFGPERMPELARGIGEALRKLRLTYIAFTNEFQGELKPIAEDIDMVTREIRQEVDAIREAADLRSLLKPYADDVNKAIALQPIAPAMPQGFAATSDATSATVAIASTAVALPQTSQSPAVNGAKPSAAQRYSPPSASTPAGPILLAEDNPWASVGAQVRTDQLDDDSPWRS